MAHLHFCNKFHSDVCSHICEKLPTSTSTSTPTNTKPDPVHAEWGIFCLIVTGLRASDLCNMLRALALLPMS